jgi:hypothetical protein
MDMQQAPFLLIPQKSWERVERDIYEIKRLMTMNESGRGSSIKIEWIPLREFLEATTWGKTQFHEKRNLGKMPENLILKRGRKVFVHQSAFDKFFAGDFD